jgi:hypothetical protein
VVSVSNAISSAHLQFFEPCVELRLRGDQFVIRRAAQASMAGIASMRRGARAALSLPLRALSSVRAVRIACGASRSFSAALNS